MTTPAALASSRDLGRAVDHVRRTCATRFFVYGTVGAAIASCVAVTWVLLQAHAGDEHTAREERVNGIEKQIDRLVESVRDGFQGVREELGRIQGK